MYQKLLAKCGLSYHILITQIIYIYIGHSNHYLIGVKSVCNYMCVIIMISTHEFTHIK